MQNPLPKETQRQTISYTPEGAVIIPYPILQTLPSSLERPIEEAFGSNTDCLGIIIISDLPASFPTRRERLLNLGYQFAQLHENIREKYADPSTSYSFGWSHGKEIMNGKPDELKGSYYANPIIDTPTISWQERQNFPEYYGNNIWPNADEKGIEGFEEAFKDLGRFIFEVGCKLAEACQPFVESSLPLSELIRTSQTTKARLLHYFPPVVGDVFSDDSVDSWCGFHLDHSLLTGLCSAMYLEAVETASPKVIAPPQNSGLYIQTRGGNLTKVTIPVKSLAFQIGEALEIMTGGRLRATPHCVRMGLPMNPFSICRETFALFMQPDTHHHLTNSQTFGQFTKEVLEQHYKSAT